MSGLALVDYDNICKPPIRSTADAEIQTHSLIDRLVQTFRVAVPALQELDVRLYGGWTDEYGSPSPLATWLHQVLPTFRSRRSGLMVRPALATAMIRFPETILRGTVRLQARPRRQKMVDGMLGCDALLAAETTTDEVAIVTDDDDLVPAALSSHATSPRTVFWIRRRPVGAGLNDHELTRIGLRIYQIEG